MSFAALFNEKAHEKALDAQRNLDTLTVQDRAEENGLIASGQAPDESKTEAEKKKKEQHTRTMTMLQLLDRSMATLDAIGTTINDALRDAKNRLHDIQDNLTNIRMMMADKKFLEEGGVLERDEATGKLKDSKKQKLVDEHIKKHGGTDTHDDAMYLAIIGKNLHELGPDAEKFAMDQDQVQKDYIAALEFEETDRQDLITENADVRTKSPEEQQAHNERVSVKDNRVQQLTNSMRNIDEMENSRQINAKDAHEMRREELKAHGKAAGRIMETPSNSSEEKLEAALKENTAEDLNSHRHATVNPLAML